MSGKKDFGFEKRADKYDDGFEGTLSEKFYKLVVDNIGSVEGLNVLDAGCGTGTILYRLSQKYSFNGYGIDAEEKMLEQARAKCPGMEFVHCSCDDTPFDDGRFDVIIACMAYHHFPDREGFSKEAARILRQGGRLYIADPKFPVVIRKVLNTAFDVHRINGRFYTADEIAAGFAAYGFEKVSVLSDSYAQLVCLEKK